MTYVEAISELQQRSLDALKVARSSQIASLETTREFAQTLSARRPSAFVAPTVIRAMTELTAGFAFALLEQQVTYAKNLADALARPPVPSALPAPRLAIAAAPPMLTTTALLDTPAASEVMADALSSPITDPSSSAVNDTATSHEMATLATDDMTTFVTGDMTALAANDMTTPVADDMTTLATGDMTAPATDDMTTPATDDMTTLATDDMTTLATDDKTALGTDDMTTPATDVTTLAADDMTTRVTDDATRLATEEAAAMAGDHPGSAAVADNPGAVSEPSDPLLGESAGEPIAELQATNLASMGPTEPLQSQTEEIISKTFAAGATSAKSAFPASSGNAARKPPKAKTVSNNRPKPKRDPGK